MMELYRICINCDGVAVGELAHEYECPMCGAIGDDYQGIVWGWGRGYPEGCLVTGGEVPV